ncbi:hypothetical protein D9758_006285 [Tetrapyrgos nigripes]|uniref:Uncharacterized protein n=1 Tax=Tetrapyrgos nigripes TaxID=182062 RepID=A0A8H5DAA9_9AGAR|nr:hypothetical protein D9758_006285 [Tetrapyrgos nigripes]
MRKISYVLTFIAVTISLVFTILAARRTDWQVLPQPLVLKTPLIVDNAQLTTWFGLHSQCQRISYDSPNSHGELSTKCRRFPTRVQDACEKENGGFCTAWTSAGYAMELSIGFAAISLFTILIGLSTGSRRRRIWKAVAGLISLHATFGIIAFGIVTDVNRTGAYPGLEYAKPGFAYASNTFSWIFSVLIAAAVVTTGISAERGHQWAAGNRAYRRIDG